MTMQINREIKTRYPCLFIDQYQGTIMANFFNNQPQATQAAPFTGAPVREVTLEEKINTAVESGLIIVAMPWGANPRKKKDGGESKHLLMTQKGPIGYGQYGVFGSVRAEGFLTWIPQANPQTGRPHGGEWQFPTAHRRGDDGDEPVPGAAIRGFHKLFIQTWKQDLEKTAKEYEGLGKAKQAKQSRMLAKSFDISSVFGTQLNFSVPCSITELKSLKAEGLAVAQSQGKAREGRATMVHNVVLGVKFAYQEDGEFGLRVEQILDWRAPLVTIPSGGGEILSQAAILEALTAPDERDSQGQLERMNAKVQALAGKRSKSSLKREARARIKKWAEKIDVSEHELTKFVKAKAGAKGLIWGAENIRPSKDEVLGVIGQEGGESQPQGQGEPEGAVEAGESLVNPANPANPETVDPADIDIEV